MKVMCTNVARAKFLIGRLTQNTLSASEITLEIAKADVQNLTDILPAIPQCVTSLHFEFKDDEPFDLKTIFSLIPPHITVRSVQKKFLHTQSTDELEIIADAAHSAA